MARLVKPLSAIQVKNAKAREKIYKLTDGGGLYLSVYPNGRKLWHMKVIQPGGKENRLSFGVYPDVSLEQAREKRDAARKLKASGVDPVQHRKAQAAANAESAANSFEVIAREWYTRHEPNWAPRTAVRTMGQLTNDLFPWIGSRPIASITAPEFLSVFRRIESRGALESAHRIKGLCGQIIRYAIATGRAENDPTAALHKALPPVKTRHLPAITEPVKVGALLRSFDDYQGSFIVTCALKMAPYVFARPGELRQAKWADIDWEKAEWRYLATKTKTEHIVPLAEQVITILKELYPLTGSGTYLFPSERTRERPMSDNTINAAFRRLGIPKDDMTAHGFRAMARTILDEVLGERVDLIEHQLAHAVRDPNGRAYNRTAHLPERKRMMQRWANYLDDLKSGAKIIPLRA